MRIGFVILSHNNPQQLRRLVLCLQQAYDNPPIAIHHDFGQSSLRQHLKTRGVSRQAMNWILNAQKPSCQAMDRVHPQLAVPEI